jgi:hypothetical protein
MTRKSPPPKWRSMGRYGDAGPWNVDLGPRSPFVADPAKPPPLTLADRYTATATGEPHDRSTLTVTVTDRETGATFESARDRITLRLSSDETAAAVVRLLQGGRGIVGLARRQTGGPVGGDGLTVAALVAQVVASRGPNGLWPTREKVAEDLTMSVSRIRDVAREARGPGKPWERILALAEASLRQ